MRTILSISLSAIFAAGTSQLPAQAVRAVAQTTTTSRTGSPLAKKISIDLVEVTVDVAVRTIAQQAGVPVTYSRARISMDRKVSLRNGSITVEDAIRRVVAPAQINISVLSDGQIVIAPSEEPRRSTTQGVVIGKVTDAKTGKAIAGANISVDNDSRGVTTSEDGAYRLTGVVAGTHTVSVRLVGYAKQARSVTVGEGASVTADFRLEASANVLDQVVVTGTVVQTELKAVPNAITVITAKQIEERGITKIDQLFRGEIPGLFSLETGVSAAGTTTASLDEVVMFSRGTTKISTSSNPVNITNPIKTYVDGVELSNTQYLSQIDPRSIEKDRDINRPAG